MAVFPDYKWLNLQFSLMSSTSRMFMNFDLFPHTSQSVVWRQRAAPSNGSNRSQSVPLGSESWVLTFFWPLLDKRVLKWHRRIWKYFCVCGCLFVCWTSDFSFFFMWSMRVFAIVFITVAWSVSHLFLLLIISTWSLIHAVAQIQYSLGLPL